MNSVLNNPRSELHALQPFGEGTSEVESLLSYFCRLAVSHSVSTLALSRSIAQRIERNLSPEFDWHQRRLASTCESAATWSAALSELTAVPNLDKLTFLPWKNVISRSGQSIVTRGQFCPSCFADDLAQDRSPYFRLVWESAEVSVCSRHGCSLERHCPHCGKERTIFAMHPLMSYPVGAPLAVNFLARLVPRQIMPLSSPLRVGLHGKWMS